MKYEYKIAFEKNYAARTWKLEDDIDIALKRNLQEGWDLHDIKFTSFPIGEGMQTVDAALIIFKRAKQEIK